MKISLLGILKESEQTSINEQGSRQFVAGFTGDAKAFSKAKPGVFAAFDDVLKFAQQDKNQIVGYTKSSPNKAVVITNVDDLLYALKTTGAMDDKVLALFNQGLLKSSKTPIELIDGITKEVVGSKSFVSRYGKMTDGEMRKALKAAGYSDTAVNSFMNNAKKNPNFKQAFKRGVAKRRQTRGGKSKNLTPKGNGQNVPPQQRKTLTEKSKELINNINVKNMSWKQLLAWGAAIGVGAYAIWWFLFENDNLAIPDDTPEDEPTDTGEWAPCIQELLNSKEGKIGTSPGGQISVSVSPPEYPAGIQFYTNGRVFDVAGKKMGRYKCKEGQVTISEQELMPYAYQYSRDNQTTPETSQQTTTDNAKIGLGNIEITWDTPGGGGGGGSTSRYHDCNSKSLPHEFGCRSEQIKKVQICLGLPEKYQTGNFGPITKKAIEDKGIDVSNGMTQSVIDKVCGSQETTPLNREPIQPITADRLKMSDLTMPKVDIKLPDIKPLEVSDEVFYNALRDNGNLIGEDGNNRIKYKGPDLDEVQLGKLDNVILPMGYTRIKNLEELKPYDSKYVWKKIS